MLERIFFNLVVLNIDEVVSNRFEVEIVEILGMYNILILKVLI